MAARECGKSQGDASAPSPLAGLSLASDRSRAAGDRPRIKLGHPHAPQKKIGQWRMQANSQAMETHHHHHVGWERFEQGTCHRSPNPARRGMAGRWGDPPTPPESSSPRKLRDDPSLRHRNGLGVVEATQRRTQFHNGPGNRRVELIEADPPRRRTVPASARQSRSDTPRPAELGHRQAGWR